MKTVKLADRRTMLRIAAGAALLPVLASQRVWAQQSSPAHITPPEGAMIYRRQARRILIGGAEIDVTRDFAVQFEPVGRGFRLRGHQVAVDVQVPDSLSEYRALETSRIESGIFPLMLDNSGQIIDGEDAGLSNEVEQAVNAMNLRLDDFSPGQHSEDEIDLMIESLLEAGAVLTSQLPRDLFSPAQLSRQQQQEITLPWGETGEVSSTFTAQRDPATGLMREARREVVTRLAGEERRMQEFWQLTSV